MVVVNVSHDVLAATTTIVVAKNSISERLVECINNGQQEYSQRQAGITSGITLAIFIPILLLFVYMAYLFLRKKQKQREEEQLQEKSYLEQQRKAQEAATRKLTEAEYNSEDEDNNSNITSSGVKETTVY